MNLGTLIGVHTQKIEEMILNYSRAQQLGLAVSAPGVDVKLTRPYLKTNSNSH